MGLSRHVRATARDAGSGIERPRDAGCFGLALVRGVLRNVAIARDAKNCKARGKAHAKAATTGLNDD
jgi:hypothetical protein